MQNILTKNIQRLFNNFVSNLTLFLQKFNYDESINRVAQLVWVRDDRLQEKF